MQILPWSWWHRQCLSNLPRLFVCIATFLCASFLHLSSVRHSLFIHAGSAPHTCLPTNAGRGGPWRYINCHVLIALCDKTNKQTNKFSHWILLNVSLKWLKPALLHLGLGFYYVHPYFSSWNSIISWLLQPGSSSQKPWPSNFWLAVPFLWVKVPAEHFPLVTSFSTLKNLSSRHSRNPLFFFFLLYAPVPLQFQRWGGWSLLCVAEPAFMRLRLLPAVFISTTP